MPEINTNTYNIEKVKENLEKDKNIISANKKLILNFLNDCEDGKTIQNRAKKRIGNNRVSKYAYGLKRFSVWFGKPFDKVTKKDVDRVISNLDKDVYKKQKVSPIWKEGVVVGVDKEETKEKYSPATKVDFKKYLIKFFRWICKNDLNKFHELTKDIETYLIQKEPDALTEEEVLKLINKCSDTKYRFLIAFLFDSGTRINEFRNLKIGDLSKTENGYRINIKQEYIKTGSKPRNIGLFWKHSNKIISDYLSQHPHINKKDNLLFDLNYNAIRVFLNRIGNKVLKRPTNPHLFRHSSATYYALKLKNRQALCNRYGWAYSSDMPDVYIRRAGLDDTELENTMKGIRLEEQAKEIEELKEQMKMYSGLLEELQNKVEIKVKK